MTRERVPPGESLKLFIVCLLLLSVGNSFKKHKVQWHTDNQNVTRIINKGSTKPDLQTLVEEVVRLCYNYSISVIPVWVPRDKNQFADYLSKLTDADDWGIPPDIFQWISTLWGPLTIDRFDTWYNTKCPRFNSRLVGVRVLMLLCRIGREKITGQCPPSQIK